MHDKDLVLGKNCKSTFGVHFSECKSKILNGARSFFKVSLRRLIKKFLLENILQYYKFLHPNSHTSDSSLQDIWIFDKKFTVISVKIDKLTDDWNQYFLEDIMEECYQSNDGKPFRDDFC